MAIITGNSIMKNVRGKFGDQVVVKSRMGIQYLSAPPSVNRKRKVSEAEMNNRKRFKRANEYAQDANEIPELKEFYGKLAKGGQTAYNVAFLDRFHGPKITGVFTHGYKGNIGDVLMIRATDNIGVHKVCVQICNTQKQLIESGNAVVNGENEIWMYTATTHVESKDVVIEVIAYDRAENYCLETTTISLL